MRTRISRTCSMMLGEATDMDKQDKKVLIKWFPDIPRKQHIFMRIWKNSKKLYFWALFLHGTSKQFLSWFSWSQGFSQRSQQVFFRLSVLSWHYSYLHCLLSDWPVGSTRAFLNQRVCEGRKDWVQRDNPLLQKQNTAWTFSMGWSSKKSVMKHFQ